MSTKTARMAWRARLTHMTSPWLRKIINHQIDSTPNMRCMAYGILLERAHRGR